MAEEITQKDIKTDDLQKVKIAPNPFPVEELYIDGISGVLGRGGVFKIDCYRVVGFDQEDKAEVRRVTHRIVLPASAMPELAQAVRGIAKSAAKDKKEDTKTETLQ